MTYKNTLCTDPECTHDCGHRGPKGQYCYFEVEKKLCQLLAKTWLPTITLDELIYEVEKCMVRENDLTDRIAERMKPEPLRVVNDDPSP